MAKRFSELTTLTAIDAQDIIAATDVDEVISKKILLSDLRSFVFNDVFANNLLTPDTLISQINAHDSGDGSNDLNADTLDGQEGTYYLDYTNFTNTPTIRTELGEFANLSGFVTYDPDASEYKLKYVSKNFTGGVLTNQGTFNIDSDDVTEGGTNRYYTTDIFRVDLQTYLQTELDQISTAFYDGNLNNSLIKCDATFPSTMSSAQSDRLTNVEFIANFNAGRPIRVYGASLDNSTIPDNTKYYGVQGLAHTFPTTGLTAQTFYYKIAEMDLTDGRISSASAATSITFYPLLDDQGNEDPRPIIDQFNETYNITVNISKTGGGQDRAVIIYRSINSSDDADFRLYQVIGLKESNRGYYIDYGTFDHVTWGPKRLSDNTYTTSIHVPMLPPTVALTGWADCTIESVDLANNAITLTDTVYGTPSKAVNISHNDTPTIQSAIDEYYADGRSALSLNDKTYVVSTIELPNNFSLKGIPNITKVAKLPWSGYGPNPSNNVIKLQNTQGADGISISDVDFDGSFECQILFDDSVDVSRNYFFNFGNAPEDILISNSKTLNVIAGGIYSPSAVNFRMRESELRNSGVSDRFDYSPLLQTQGNANIIASNAFQNYTLHLDVSIGDKILVTNNIINNCGNGLLVYGSRFLISSPNILIGPADELLPSPDVLNSIYDAVNIELTEDQQYTSDVYRYQENGFNYDLTANEGTLSFDLYKLEKEASGAENLYEKIVDSVITFNQVSDFSLDPTEGLFQFRIQETSVNQILNNYNYATLAAVNADHVGLVYVVGLTTSDLAGTIQTANLENEVTLTLSGANSFAAGELITQDNSGANGLVKTATINSNTVTMITVSGTFTNNALDLINGSIAGATGEHPSTVVGPVNDGLYSVVVNSYSNIAIGDSVRLNDHNGFNVSTGNYVGEIFKIVEDQPSGTAIVTIQYDNSATLTPGAAEGTLRNISEKTIVKGRVL